MVRYWVIAPILYEDSEVFSQYWKYDLENEVISIGWGMGDLGRVSFEEFERRFQKSFPDERRNRHQVWNFWKFIQEGDYVIARAGRKKVAGIGVVTGPAFYSRKMGQEQNRGINDHPNDNFLPVRWEGGYREFRSQVFGMQTVTEMTLERYEELFISDDNSEDRNNPDKDAGSPSQVELPSTEFAMERYLEEFMESNFDQIIGGKLSLNRRPNDDLGRQYHTEVGVIDILAWRPVDNTYVVIELKRGKGSDVVVGQTLRYMGWVKRFLCKGKENVEGLIVCKNSDDRLEIASGMVPDIHIQYYRVDFQLMDSPTN